MPRVVAWQRLSRSALPCVVGLLLVMVGLFHAIAQPAAKSSPERQHLTHVHIGGRDFAVPNEYFRGPIPDEAESKQLYLWMMLPDYAPYRGFDIETTKSAIHVAERHVRLLIDDTASTTDLKFRYNAARHGLGSYIPKDVEPVYGLKRTLIYRSTKKTPTPFIWWDLYYVEKPSGDVAVFIDCRMVDSKAARYPQCEHHFQDDRLLFNIGYAKSNLSSWRDIEDRVRALINDFSCMPSDSGSNLTTTENGGKPCPH